MSGADGENLFLVFQQRGVVSISILQLRHYLPRFVHLRVKIQVPPPQVNLNQGAQREIEHQSNDQRQRLHVMLVCTVLLNVWGAGS